MLIYIGIIDRLLGVFTTPETARPPYFGTIAFRNRATAPKTVVLTT